MWLDAVAIALLALFAFLGARRGGLAAGLSLLGIVVAYAASLVGAPRLGDAAASAFGVVPLAGVGIAGALVFVAVSVAMALVSWLVRRMESGPDERSPRDRLLGACFGATRGLVMVLLLAYAALWADALHTTGVVPGAPEVGHSAAAALAGSLAEAGLDAAVGDTAAGRMMARVAARPGRTLADLEEVLQHPAIVALRDDSLFWSHVEYGNIDAAMNRRGFVALTYDADLRRRLGELGMLERGPVEDPAAFLDFARGVLEELGPRLRELRDDPALQELLADPEVMAAVESGDHLALMTNPDFRRVVARAMEPGER